MFRVAALSRLMMLMLVSMVLGIVLVAGADARSPLAGLNTMAKPANILFPYATAFAYDASGR